MQALNVPTVAIARVDDTRRSDGSGDMGVKRPWSDEETRETLARRSGRSRRHAQSAMLSFTGGLMALGIKRQGAAVLRWIAARYVRDGVRRRRDPRTLPSKKIG